MTTKLSPMERALLDTLDQLTTAAQVRDKRLSDKIDALTQQLQQHEVSVTQLQCLLRPFTQKGSGSG